MDRRNFTIPVTAGESVSAVLTLPDKNRALGTGVITAHGAGNDMENALLIAFTDGLAEAGYPALRFNFPYKDKGLKAPDRPKKLEDTWAAVYRYFHDDPTVDVTRIIAAGKSMGGRIASQMAAEKTLPVEGLIFLGYPLHPANNRSKTRDAHLYRVEKPMLFFAGTRDRLCDLAKLQVVMADLPAPWRLEVIEGGDHSFHVPKTTGIKEPEIFRIIVRTAIQWLETTFT